MRTRDYIDLVRKMTGTGTDYAVAQLTQLSPDAVRKYRIGKRIMDNSTCLKLAVILDRPVAELVAAAEIERASPNNELKAMWRAIYNHQKRAPGIGLPPQ